MRFAHERDSRYGEPELLKGNEAICEGAIWAGCRFFFGYPITPQNQIPEMMSRRMPEVGGAFVQGESELASISMVFGAAAAGVRAMTSSSSPGISLMQEGISYLAGAELPCVVVNVQRGGPGLGNIAGAQADYLQAVQSGHGDMRIPVYAPGSVQEMYDLMGEAFETADRNRSPVIVLADAMLGQMAEPMQRRVDEAPAPPAKPWALTGARGRPRNLLTSLYTLPDNLEAHNQEIDARYQALAPAICRAEEYRTDGADVLLVSYGISSRMCQTACDSLRERGIAAGLLRPVTLRPFPTERLAQLSEGARLVLVVEMSMGQLIYDVRLAVLGRCPVELLGRPGGNYSTAPDIVTRVVDLLGS